MTTALISPAHYCDRKYHSRELQNLFRKSWLFAGLKHELQGRVHLGVQLGETSVLLLCDETGTPRAYLNVCSHRHAQICGIGKHEGAIRCPYHSWVYNRDGIPTGIPQRAAFPDVAANPENYRLMEFPCEAVGEFIFVRLSRQGATLREYLGNQHAFLERASIGMNGVLDEFRQDVPANWKVVIENSLEGYHIPSVHSGTFGQVTGMSREESAPVFVLDDPRHSHLEHRAEQQWLDQFSRQERKIGQWPWRFEHYTHHLIFPNLTVTSFMGYSFHVQRFEPTAATLTTVHSRTVGVTFENQNEMGRKMMAHIHADGHAFTRRVFDEDGSICAKVQAGIQQAVRPAVIGKGLEDRIAHFQRAYRSAMAEPSSDGLQAY
jgi:choline monooxygenase